MDRRKDPAAVAAPFGRSLFLGTVSDPGPPACSRANNDERQANAHRRCQDMQLAGLSGHSSSCSSSFALRCTLISNAEACQICE